MKRIRNLMSALLGRNDLHDVSAVPLPRVSRLTDAAMVFLVAASGVFFVCAPGNAVNKIKTIKITQTTVSATDTFEGESHTTTASLFAKPGRILRNLDNRAVRVEWSVEADGDDDPEHEWTDNKPGASSDFTFTYGGLGSTTGSAVVVKAVAFDALGDSDTAETTINVWKKSETVKIISQTTDQTLVGATMTDVSVQTDVGFYRVDWSVDDGVGRVATVTTYNVPKRGGTVITDNGPGLTSQIAYDFSTVPHGNTVTFTATPYGVNAKGAAVAGKAATIKIVAWKMISINDVSPTKLKVVKGEELHMHVRTNIPFSRLEYSVEFGGTHTINSKRANSTGSLIPIRFNNVGSNNNPLEGNELDIVVTAYATINGKEFKSDPVTGTVTVYAGNGVVWKRVVVYIDSFRHFAGDNHSQTTLHTATYYNDDASPGLVSFFRRNGWWVGDRRDHAHMTLFDGRTIDGWVRPELGYTKTVRDIMTSNFVMKWDKFHGGHAVTGFNGKDAGVIPFNTLSDGRYFGPGSSMPDTGMASDRNYSQKGKKLAD